MTCISRQNVGKYTYLYESVFYRAKDVVEKSFSRLKNTLDLNRLRGGLYKTYTMHELLLKVRKLRVARLNGKRIVQPISKEQHEIFKALGFEDPVG